MKNNKFYSSEFYCTECGQRGIPCIRNIGKNREPGHLKNLYCIYCKKEVNHAEVRPGGNYTLEDFREEFNLGIFIEGKRKEDV